MKEIAIAGAALMLMAASPPPAGAQDRTGWDGGAQPPHAVDAGAGTPEFYDVAGFADRIEARINASAMSDAQKRTAMNELRAIRAQLEFRMQRKGGELRDWDRELIHSRLTRLSDRIGGGSTGL